MTDEMPMRPAAVPWAPIAQQLDPWGVGQLIEEVRREAVRAARRLADAREAHDLAPDLGSLAMLARAEEADHIAGRLWHTAGHLAGLAEAERLAARQQRTELDRLLTP